MKMITEQLSALEQFALQGILELDITRGTKRFSFPGGGSYVLEFATKPGEVYNAARTLIEECPKVVEGVTHYFLNAENSHYHKSERIVYAVSLLKRIGKADEEIVQEVVDAIRGETAYHTIERYHSRLGNKHNRDGNRALKDENPKMYEKVMDGLTHLITPRLIIEAVAGLRGKDEKHASEHLFQRLCRTRDLVQRIIDDQNAPQRKYLADFIDNARIDIKECSDEIAEKSSLIHDLLTEFSNTFGHSEFERRGYSYNALQEFNEEVRSILWEDMDKNLQKLSQELEKEKCPWYRKLF